MPLAFYVYYRVDPLAADDVRARVDMLFHRLERQCGVRGRLLAKRGEPCLWMEVYERITDGAGFEAALQAEASALGLETVLAKGTRRNVEAFEGE